MNGTLSAKIQRHENASISCPPTSGPITVAMPDHAVHEPIAAPRWAGGKAVTMTASAAGESSAPNIALQHAARHDHLDARRDRADDRGHAEAE